MKKTISIKENKDFKRLYYRGKNAANEFLAIYWRRTKNSYCRLGLTVSGKVGKAVVRNRIRRLIKESYRLMEDEVRTGTELVVVARSRAAEADWKTIDKSLKKLLKKSGIIEND